MKRNSVTLDSWAVLAWLQKEPSGGYVRDLLLWSAGDGDGSRVIPHLAVGPERPAVLMNVVNLGEVFYIVGRRNGVAVARDTVRALRTTSVRIVPADDQLVMEAASIKIDHRVSFAGAFAVATARLNDSILITGDLELKELPGIAVHWIGPHS